MTHSAASLSASDEVLPGADHASTAPTAEAEQATERPLARSALRGWRRRCPACGEGPMMRGYLGIRDHCPVCAEPLHHHRADDGPAYLAILIVGHIMAPVMLAVFLAFRPDPLVTIALFGIGTITLSLYLLPRLKGFMVGFQWARRMHGFGGEEEPSAD